MTEEPAAETVSVEELERHWGYHRWSLERGSAVRWAMLWSGIGASQLADADKVTLTSVIWSLASLERAYRTLEANVRRVQEAMNVGVPPVMAFLSGPFPMSLDYVLGQSLWLDLAEILIWYRAVIDRLSHLKRAARADRICLTVAGCERELAILRGRRLPELSTSTTVGNLANNLLHESWHPTTPKTPFALYWRGEEGHKTIHFTEQGDLMDSVFQLVAQTIDQVKDLVDRLTGQQTPEG